MKKPLPPKQLSAHSQKLWASIHDEYELAGEAVELLRIALENLDLADIARESLRSEGHTLTDSKGVTRKNVKLIEMPGRGDE